MTRFTFKLMRFGLTLRETLTVEESTESLAREKVKRDKLLNRGEHLGELEDAHD